MRILQIAFLLSICGCLQALLVPMSDVLEIAKLSKNVTIHLFKTFALLDQDVRLTPNASKTLLFKEFKVLKNKMDMFNNSSQLGWQVLGAMVNYTNIESQLKLKIDEVKKNIDFIYAKFEDMETLIENKDKSIVMPSNSILQSVLDGIHFIIAGGEFGVQRVFDTLIEIMRVQGNKMFCKMNSSSAQQVVLYLYNTLAFTELKGFLMIELSYMILKLDKQGNVNKEMEVAQERHKFRSATTLKSTIEAVQSAPLEFWKCDPDKQVKNETYIEITEFLQGYIVNENNIGEKKTCKFIKSTLNYQSYKCTGSNENMFCNKNRQCTGNLHNCRTITEGAVCFADECADRRYEYISQKAKSFGRWNNCSISGDSVSIKGWYTLGVFCDYFMCLCDEQTIHSDRYFSLLSEQSHLYDNKVVTGLRFVKKHGIIHLQIQQGKLLPMGQIDVTTVGWKPVTYLRRNDMGILNGKHYHTLTWDERGLDLDDRVAEEGKVLTGVRFVLNGSVLQLQIHTTPFNITTGRLDVKESEWWLADYPRKGRKKVDTDNKDVPILDPDSFGFLSIPGTYLEFTHSSLEMDIGQTAVPFIDVQPVTLAQPVPLSGAGIIYRGSKRFGGFIALNITTYNYNNILRNTYNDHNSIYLQF